MGAVGALRGAVSLSDLSPVLDPARQAGFDVSARIETGALPEAVDAAAYRIVQEAVTNVVRHAPEASMVSVNAAVANGVLRLTVTDDGPPGGIPGDGHGLAGMAERARALGGAVRTRHTGRGFIVEAELPLRGTA